ncbi:unnamed protein product [Orchesella dallaii]|uniref:Uncharacterized protein n=1 Tax=Orchesella dallaii TaxID=48710 RepID=A0ABP1QNR0_9HEXA
MSLPSTSKSSSTSQPTYPAMECEDSFSKDCSRSCGVLGCNEQDIRKLFTPPSFARIYNGWPEEGTKKPSTNATEERDVLYGLQREDPDPTDHSNYETNQNDGTSPPTLDYEEMCVDEEMDVDDTGGESVNRHQQKDYLTQESTDEILYFVASGYRETSVQKLTNENLWKDSSRSAITKIQLQSGKTNVTLKDPVLGVLTSSYQTGQLNLEQIAYSVPAPHLLPVGTRAIAFRNDFHIYKKLDAVYYSGIVGEEEKPSTKKFFYPNDVFPTYNKSGLPSKHVYPEHLDFIKMFLDRYSEWPLVHLPIGGLVSAEWNGKRLVTRVLEQNCSPVKLTCEYSGEIEGST